MKIPRRDDSFYSICWYKTSSANVITSINKSHIIIQYPHCKDMTILLSHHFQVQRQIDKLGAEVLNQLFEVWHYHSKQLEILNRNIKIIALQPVLWPMILVSSLRVPKILQVGQGMEQRRQLSRQKIWCLQSFTSPPSPYIIYVISCSSGQMRENQQENSHYKKETRARVYTVGER